MPMALQEVDVGIGAGALLRLQGTCVRVDWEVI